MYLELVDATLETGKHTGREGGERERRGDRGRGVESWQRGRVKEKLKGRKIGGTRGG